jgi:23S rRNA (cytidine2498-2'-O)-methyltransferase
VTGWGETAAPAPAGRVMFSVAEQSFGSAVRELRTEYGRTLPIERVGPDLGVIAATTPKVDDVAAACTSRPLVFVRHLTVEMARVAPEHARDVAAVASAARSTLVNTAVEGALAVQTWVSGSAGLGYGSRDLFAALAEDLTAHGFAVSRAGQEHVLSCCITARGVSVGLNRREDSLSDWPGGRVRLARDDAQVSRSEFKLEELFGTVPLPLPAKGRAVDLGASPGGWTRILRQHGMEVWAVDPGGLDTRITADRGVHHVPTTAGQFFRSNDVRFDLAANDMKMDPVMSTRVMLTAAAHLRHGALAIVTLKTGTHRPVETVRRCLTLLGRSYQLVYARQLHHNRNEVTVVCRRRATR